MRRKWLEEEINQGKRDELRETRERWGWRGPRKWKEDDPPMRNWRIEKKTERERRINKTNMELQSKIGEKSESAQTDWWMFFENLYVTLLSPSALPKQFHWHPNHKPNSKNTVGNICRSSVLDTVVFTQRISSRRAHSPSRCVYVCSLPPFLRLWWSIRNACLFLYFSSISLMSRRSMELMIFPSFVVASLLLCCTSFASVVLRSL